MCKYASFVLTKDQIFWSTESESHEDIIREHSLCECDSSKTRINIVRVEISPVKVWGDLSQWAYKVDQDRVPDWYDAQECEARTRRALAKKVDKRLLSAFKDLDEFLAEIAKVKFFQSKGNPVKSWKIFYGKTWAAAWDAAGDAASDAAEDAAEDAAWNAAWAAASDAARAAAGDAARDAARDAAGDAARDAAEDAAEDAAWNAAWAAASDAARAAAGDAARDAARDAAGDAARDAAWAAAWDAAGDAAWNAAWAAAGDAAWNAAWAAARAAALIARIIVCKGLPLDTQHIRHAKARWNVWKRGYGLYCDMNGVLYVYAAAKNKETLCQ